MVSKPTFFKSLQKNNIYFGKFKLKGVKSVSKIKKWTKKMSNFPKRKYFMKKGSKFRHSEHYGMGHQKNHPKFVMPIFKYFWRKKLRGFFYCYIKQCLSMKSPQINP